MTMKTIAENIQEIEDDFSLFDQWVDKYAYIIDLGKSLPLIAPQYKDEEHLIRGCQSQVWLAAEPAPQGRIVFTTASDALITKGIISLLVKILSGQTPEEIASADLSFIDRIGLSSHLSPTRANGLYEMIKQMKYYAAALGAKK